jgi:hypothetical protein
VQSQTHATKQSYATQSEAKTKTPNPHTWRKAGLNHLSRGLGKTAHRGPARGSRRDVRARPTQGRVFMAKGNPELPERRRDACGPREARPASLHRLVSHPRRFEAFGQRPQTRTCARRPQKGTRWPLGGGNLHPPQGRCKKTNTMTPQAPGPRGGSGKGAPPWWGRPPGQRYGANFL